MNRTDKRKKQNGQNVLLYDPFAPEKRKFNQIIGGKTMKSLQQLIMLTVLMLLAVNTTKAQLNPVVTMQGFLTDSTGRALPDGTYQSKFRIYNNATGGTLLWEESHDLSLDHGLYDALLGSVTPFNLTFTEDYWLSVEVDGQGEQQPRIRVGYSFFSIKSLKSDSSAFAENSDLLGGRPASFYDPVTSLSFDSLSGTASDAQIPDDITINRAGNADSLGHKPASDYLTEAELAQHKGDEDAHHDRYTDADAVIAMGVKDDNNPLNHDKLSSLDFSSVTGTASDAQIPDNITIENAKNASNADSLAGRTADDFVTDDELTSHTSVSNAHHVEYTDSDAISAMGPVTDSNSLNHAKYSDAEAISAMGSKSDVNALKHDRYNDSDAVDAMGNTSDSNVLNHTRYTDTESVSSMGIKVDGNALNHDRYNDAEATTAMGAKSDSNPLNHDRTTALSFSSITGVATDAQIPDNITVDRSKSSANADSLGSLAASVFTTDSELSSHESDAAAHHARYADTEAVSAMGVKSDSNPLNHDKTQSLAFGSITGTASDAQIPDNITIVRAAGAGDADSLAGIAASAYALKSDIPSGGGGGGSGAFATLSNVTSNNPGDLASDDFVFGSTGLDDDGNGDHDRRFFFDKSKGAFRAGFSNLGKWNESNLGDFSAAFGRDTEASGNWSTAFGRDAEASGNWSIAMGLNVIANANNSIALGSYASTNEKNGSIVFGDASSTTDVTADNMNQFKVRASGGVTFLTNSNMTVGVVLSSGSGTWLTLSDSTMKRNIRGVDTKKILDKVMELPIKQWNYKSQAAEIQHIGPMAQDFYSIFEIGENDLTISTIDPSGIALAAIQELYRNTKELESRTREINDLREEVTELRELINGLVDNNIR